MKFTENYINDVLSRGPYLKAEWLEKIINNPVRAEVQSDGRVRYWGYVEDIAKYLRVIIEPDGESRTQRIS